MPIHFGTDGWRDVIAQDFTYGNVEVVAGAHARHLVAEGGRSVVVGFDTRFQGAAFARVVADVMARHGLHVHLAKSYVPTPVLSFAVKHLGAAGGVMITASHNPPEYSGYKLKGAYGGSATPGVVRSVELSLSQEDAFAGTPGEIETFDVRKAYFQALDGLLDLDTLRGYRGRMYHDAMGGAGGGWIEGYVKHAKLNVELRPLHGVPHPLFYGVNPEPIPQNLAALMTVLAGEGGAAFGTATDGDADRVGAVTAGGQYFNSHKIVAVLLRHLHGRGLRGRVVKTVSGSAIIDRLAQHLNLEVLETPIGFKYITDAMLEGERDPARSVLLGGEESGGIGVQGHIPERDGILNSLLMLEAVAASGKGLDTLFAEIEELTGLRHFYDRNDLHLDASFDKAAALSRARGWDSVGGLAVTGVNDRDGVKLLLDGGAWVLLRASGTEPIVRVYAEASDAGAQRAVLDDATRRLKQG